MLDSTLPAEAMDPSEYLHSLVSVVCAVEDLDQLGFRQRLVFLQLYLLGLVHVFESVISVRLLPLRLVRGLVRLSNPDLLDLLQL